MIFFFVAFSINWASSGDIYSRVIVGAVILVTLLVILYGIICTRNSTYWRQVINWLHHLQEHTKSATAKRDGT